MTLSTRSITPCGASPLLLLATIWSASAAGTVVPLTPDSLNSSTPGFGSSIEATLNDPFAYDLDDPTALLPNQVYSGAVAYHGNEVDGVDVLVSYTIPATTPTGGETFVIDLYGRIGANCCTDRDNDFDIELYSGGISGTLVEKLENLAIPDTEPAHLRVTFTTEVEIDSIRIVARDAENADPVGSYFTLQEIRAALIDPIIDTDGDGLPDAWEDAHGLDKTDNGDIDPINGAIGDPDNDLLNNLAEFEAETDPQDNDSDDDTLLDGAEVAGADSRPPTDPNSADSDGDTLSDLVETNTGIFTSASDTGSNPTLADSDSDGALDSDEVRRNSDPNDPNSGSNLALGKSVGFFDAAGTPTSSWNVFPPEYIIDGNLATISHTLDAASADYYFELDLGEEISISFVSLTGRGFHSDCCADRLENTTLLILDEARNQVHSETLDGQIIFTREVDLSAAQPRGRFVQVVNTGGFNYGPQLGELEVYGSTAPPKPPVITDISVDILTGDVTLTFDSQTGATYFVFASNTLGGAPLEINDNLPSQGLETTTTFRDPGIIGQSQRFYWIEK